MEQRDYTVCFLFSKDHKEVLLQTKNATDFAGRLNGVGGKVELGETPEECALREIREETNIEHVDNLSWAGTIFLGDNCDNHQTSTDPMSPACVLYYYTGEVENPSQVTAAEGGEAVKFYTVDAVLREPVTSKRFAGDGDLQYMVNRALEILNNKTGAVRVNEHQVSCPRCHQVYKQLVMRPTHGGCEWSEDTCPHCGKSNGSSLVFIYKNTK